jgi:hypothetical protein
LLVNEDEICGSGTEWLEQNGAFGLRLNVDDIGISDQHSVESSLKHKSRPGAELKSDAGGRSLDARFGGSAVIADYALQGIVELQANGHLAGHGRSGVAQQRETSEGGKGFLRIHRAFSEKLSGCCGLRYAVTACIVQIDWGNYDYRRK